MPCTRALSHCLLGFLHHCYGCRLAGQLGYQLCLCAERGPQSASPTTTLHSATMRQVCISLPLTEPRVRGQAKRSARQVSSAPSWRRPALTLPRSLNADVDSVREISNPRAADSAVDAARFQNPKVVPRGALSK